MTELLPLVLLAPILAWIGWSDLTRMRIPNRAVLAALALFVACAPFLPVESLVLRCVAAGAVLSAGFAAFALRLVGGGDVKMLAALMLFVAPGTLSVFGLVFSAALLIGLTGIVTLRASPWTGGTRWVSLRARGMFPMGVSIALAGIAHPWVLASLAL